MTPSKHFEPQQNFKLPQTCYLGFLKCTLSVAQVAPASVALNWTINSSGFQLIFKQIRQNTFH